MMKDYMADALLLLMEKKAYSDITISEITTKAGVNRSTFYRNFNDKGDIIKHHFNQIIYRHRASVTDEPESIQSYLTETFSHYYRYKNELLLIHKAKLTHILLDAFNVIFSEIHADKTKKEYYATRYHTGGIYNNYLLWFEGGMTETPSEMAEICASFYPPSQRPYMWPKE